MTVQRDSLSKCDLWRAQRAFFEQQGIEAWRGKVPFYITSNPYLAGAYANLIMRFMQDHRARNPAARPTPFYIVELGAGSGAFSFYLLKRLLELQNEWFMFEEKFVYVMTDLSEKNIAFWKTHPGFQPFLEQKVLDFAMFDLEKSDAIVLPDGPLDTGDKPLIVLANYIFDSAPCDLFRLRQGKLEEWCVSGAAALPDPALEQTFFKAEELDSEAFYRDTPLPHFQQPELDKVLAYYQEQAPNTHILFPSCALDCLERLRKRSPEMLMLLADKGTLTRELDEAPAFAIHGGCFSSMVDLHALGVYAKNTGGEAFHHPSEGITLSAFSIGRSLRDLPETRRALAQSLAIFNPGHIYEVFNYFVETKPRARLETVTALLELTYWDPVVFEQFFDVIMASLPFAARNGINRIADNVHRIAGNIYHLPGKPDIFSLLGNFLQEIKRQPEALHYYGLSLAAAGEVDHVYYNMGLCHYALQSYDLAIGMFNQALRITPGYILAKGWIAHIGEEIGSMP